MTDMVAWNVYVPNEDREGPVFRRLDTVFYDRGCDARYVRETLIEHDGYPDVIEVTRQKITFNPNRWRL